MPVSASPESVPSESALPESVDVLIVGAGPTGLALALDLARRGVRALLVARAAELFPGSRGKGLQPRTLEVLDDLGVLAGVRAVAGHYPVNLFWKDGEPQGERRMYDPTEPSERAFDTDLGFRRRFRAEVLPDFVGAGGQAS
ncbi:FAD-dependent monooxygenase, partial [Kitasatospora sp. NPDC059747]|uniref:FAD-dependent monooxygenase n=1 Tax=Kitasatospora sp. NPDC059747 TaxID=3346930 RepID=UPI003655F0C9